MGWPCYTVKARLGFRRRALLALYSTRIKYISCSPQIISVCVCAITQLTRYRNIATHAQENGRTVFEGCSQKQSGVTLKAAKGIYIYVAMWKKYNVCVKICVQTQCKNMQCVAHVAFFSSRLKKACNGGLAKTELHIFVENRCHDEFVINLVKINFLIRVLVFSFHLEVKPSA